MSVRIHMVISEAERSAFAAEARRQGLTLSAWIRDAARARLERDRPTDIRSVADLDAFFAACARREQGAEPDWDAHLAVAGRSRTGPTEVT
jgi:hypothetical protein